MVEYCEICESELDEEDEAEGICKKCKAARETQPEYKKDEDFIDPAVT